ncbi:MAG: sulfotransferase [Halioglobus sp.]
MKNVENEGALPNLLVLGAQKAGSTWLHERLEAHPDIFMSNPKELRFFGHRDKTDSAEGISAYKSEFCAGTGMRYRGESTPAYFWSKDIRSQYGQDLKRSNVDIPSVVARILEPEPALIISLRNPVARAISAFYHHHRAGNIDAAERIQDRGNRWGIIDMGFYQRHMEAWLKYFKPQQLHVVLFDDIIEQPQKLVTELYHWLGLRSEIEDRNLLHPSNRGRGRPAGERGKEPVITQDDIHYLNQLYAEDVSFVEHYLSRKLPTWRSAKLQDYL